MNDTIQIENEKSLFNNLERKFLFSFCGILISFQKRLLISIELRNCARLVMVELRCFVVVKLVQISMI